MGYGPNVDQAWREEIGGTFMWGGTIKRLRGLVLPDEDIQAMGTGVLYNEHAEKK